MEGMGGGEILAQGDGKGRGPREGWGKVVEKEGMGPSS